MLSRMAPAVAKALMRNMSWSRKRKRPEAKSIDHIHAAAIPVVALTAWQALFDQAGLSKGQKLLIHGAAGGVGSVAVQLAKWKGQCHRYCVGEESGSSLELGVDEPIDYEKTRFEDIVTMWTWCSTRWEAIPRTARGRC